MESKPELGIAYLRYLTAQPWCRKTILEKHRDELITLLTLMKDVMVSSRAMVGSFIKWQIFLKGIFSSLSVGNIEKKGILMFPMDSDGLPTHCELLL